MHSHWFTLVGMRIARFSLNDKPRYAFVQQDPADGKDYLIMKQGDILAII